MNRNYLNQMSSLKTKGGLIVNQKLVAMTTIRQGSSENTVERIRAEIFLDTAIICANSNIELTAVYKDCSKFYLEQLEDIGVLLFEQQTQGMGAVRREAMRFSINKFGSNHYYLWFEPEKPSFPPLAQNVTAKLGQVKAKFCFFNRRNLDSYPPEQAYYYLFCRSVASQLVGYDLDYAFGPMIMTKTSSKFFLDYKGEYGDLWDSILIPRLRIIRSNLSSIITSVDFKNDPRMTKIESGNPEMILKRVRQLQNVIPSLIAEWQK